MRTDYFKGSLNQVIVMTKKMGFNNSVEVFQEVYDKYQTEDKIYLGTLLKGEKLLIQEFTESDQSYKNSFNIFKKILDNVYKKRLPSGRKVDLLEDENNRLENIENSLGVIYKEIKLLSSKPANIDLIRTLMLLLCLAHVIRYEAYVSSSGFFRNKLIELINIGLNISKEERDQMIENLLTIKIQGTDGKSDMTHLRNSMAHGRFYFIDQNIIRFEDYSKDIKTFEIKLDQNELFGLSNMFEKKIKFLILYSILIQLFYNARQLKNKIVEYKDS